ncbi:MAG: class I SAM-dependent methyltransferase [Beijerinckiaceae bacterium]|nr:class I SAM-dependent methyltransferase [Beijerinckiaceae bacterium]
MDWREYWNGPHSIYANERHRTLHFDLIARDIARLIPSRDAAVLDYGCGEADTADALAAACGRLYLFDTADTVRARLAEKHASDARISVLDEAGLENVPDGSLDLIVVNSVLQYLTQAELVAILDFARDKLKASGTLALGDVIPENANAIADTKALLGFAFQGGFLAAAFAGLVKTALSDYRKLRETLGLTRYTEAGMLKLLADNGFTAERAARNIGHNQERMLFLARPARVQSGAPAS